MRKTLVVTGAALMLAGVPTPASAWGVAAHRYIMSRAIDLLPPALKSFFDRSREELVLRVIDPDLWRIVGWDEDSNHFVNFGVPEYGSYPFPSLPREYGAAVEKFGTATLKRNGLLPWREAEEFNQLRRAFEAFGRNSPVAAADTVLFAAVAAHYIQDAHQPLHATRNYDGQLTGQPGVHARFETALFERVASRVVVKPGPPLPIKNARDVAFDVLLDSYQLVDPLLKADKDASAGRESYDEEYFERFFAGVRPLLEKRLADSITATASLIVGAWDLAGRPALRTDIARPVQKVPR